MSFQVFILVFVAIINVAILWIIASQTWRSVASRYFAYSVFFVLLWVTGTALFYGATSRVVADVGIQLFYIAPMFTILCLSLFAAIFRQNDTRRLDLLNVILLATTLLGAVVIVSIPALLTQDIAFNFSGNILSVNNFWFTWYVAYFNTAFLITFIRLFNGIRKHEGIKRQQFTYIFIGTFLTAFFSLITNLIMPLLGDASLIWIGPTSSLFYVATVAFSIIKHGLFDIRQTVVRTVAYIISLSVLAVIYYAIAYIISVTLFQSRVTTGVSVNPINILLAILLAFMFQPIKQFFDKQTNAIFYRDRYDSSEFFGRLSDVLATTTRLSNLLQRASYEVATTLKSEQAFFFIYHNQTHYISAGTAGHSLLPPKDAEQLDDYVIKEGASILVTELLPDTHSIHRLLISHKIAIVMPLLRGNAVIGYLALGDQRNGSYTNRDLKVLATISNELIIAIQNALSVQEVRDINKTLQQRIDAATEELRASNAQLRHLDTTKDEFLSMASHQLRTPLTSVKGYISMVLEGDAGKITDMQKHLLSEAFTSSERMVHLIHDFLNVSRLQTGKFMLEQHPFDLKDLIKGEVDSLRHSAEARRLKLKFISRGEIPLLNIDESKIRQVVMNFIDNALYYSPEDTTITVKLTQADGNVELRVEDAGIGVPKSEQKHLFTKFYRASNARKQRPDGTGVGIFLAKKVVVAHGGDVIFESEEGKGSTFGFTLPLKDLQVDLDENSN